MEKISNQSLICNASLTDFNEGLKKKENTFKHPWYICILKSSNFFWISEENILIFYYTHKEMIKIQYWPHKVNYYR